MRSPEALFDIRRRSAGFNTGASSLSSTPRIPFSNGSSSSYDLNHRASPSSSYVSPSSFSTVQRTRPSVSSVAPYGQQESQPASMNCANPLDLDQGSVAQLHPAIRAHYAAMLQRTNAEVHTHQPNTGARVASPNQHTTSAAPPSSADPHAASNLHTASTPPVNPEFPQRVENNRTSPATMDQKLPASTTSNSSAKSTPVLRQTYIPPPRPWETLRKMQTPVHPVQQPQPFNSPTLAPAPPATMPTTSSPFVNGEPVYTRIAASPGLQPSNVSGPFWQKFPQTMPNSNSLTQPNQTGHRRSPYSLNSPRSFIHYQPKTPNLQQTEPANNRGQSNQQQS